MGSYPLAYLPTYMFASGLFTPPATPTDVLTIAGSATKVIRITEIALSTMQTTAGVNTWYLIKRSTLDTGGSPAAINPVVMDSTDPAPTAVVQRYTANPTVGTAVGTFWAGRVASPAAATVGIGRADMLIDFLEATGKPLTLRGAAESVALNFAGAALPAGLSVAVWATFSEE